MSTLGFCDLSIAYDGVIAVNGFNDILHSGEWLCLIGPNGAGKSSVLRAAAGLVKYSGSVAIDQKEIPATSAKWRAKHIAFVPQTPLMPENMSVYEYVLLGRAACRLLHSRKRGVEKNGRADCDAIGCPGKAGYSQ